MNEMKPVKCKNCGKCLFDTCLFDIEAVCKIETKCPKCGKIVTVDISMDGYGKLKMVQKIA